MDDEDKDKILLDQIPKPTFHGPRAKSIGYIVDRLMTQRGYANEQSTQLIQEQWSIAVGAHLATQSKVGRIVRGVLQIHAANHLAMMELQLQKGVALKHLQKSLPTIAIKDIMIRIVK